MLQVFNLKKIFFVSTVFLILF